jgi:transcriptional regulator with XRE-family HTH domain
MDAPPGKVIRSLRQALHMTQAEFARAAGWSASTISSWERGSTQPSRVAFKTILAFAEERGVRYQPRGEGAAPAPPSTLPVLRLGSRLPAPSGGDPAPRAMEATPVAALDHGREESFGSRRWTEIAAHGSSGAFEPARSIGERPEWQVEARLHVRVGAGAERLRRTGYVAASLLALVVGLGAGVWLRSGARSHAPASRVVERAEPPAARSAASAPASEPHVQVDELALTAFAAPALPGPPLAAGQAAEPPPVEPGVRVPRPGTLVPPTLARLESIVALDGVRRATFRVGDRSIALVEGDEIGGRAIALIANDEVALVRGGVAERVRLGSETPID